MNFGYVLEVAVNDLPLNSYTVPFVNRSPWCSVIQFNRVGSIFGRKWEGLLDRVSLGSSTIMQAAISKWNILDNGHKTLII